VLAGLITTQTLRPDGSILATPGYDPATQLLLIDPPAMKEIPEKPTYEDAREALAVLKDMLSEFPFVDAGGDSCTARAVALSAIVSTVCRGAYPVVPMHAIDAPAAGTGKSYLLSTVSLISTGQPMPVMSAGKTVEETEKRLGAAVIAGQTLICIDNVEGELGGDALCQLIEQVRPNVRILGQSKLIEVDGRSMSIFANGNNFTLVGDVYRRVVTGRLDAGVDRPEKRQFTKDPAALILADRGKYVAACLVICRAYQVAGRPGKKPQIGSFNGWSDTVRSALAWLGEADCVETMDDARAEDPHRQAQEALLTAWRNTFGKRPMLLRDVVVKCDERTAGMRIEGAMPYTYPELRAAVQGTNPEAHRMSINVNALGQKMRHYKDQWINGMRFTKQERSGEVLWCAEATERPTLRTKATTKKPE
jgi:putative DNA primase/helicase